MFKKTLLVNKHGDEFTGWSEYSFKPATGELIFNTAMTGFVEILSDPSYINQIVTFTSSHIGNYGLSEIDFESNKPKIEAAVGNTFSHSPSSWRSQKALTSWLAEYEIPFSGGFDVRAITKYLRDRGTSMYALGVDIDKNDLLELLNSATNILGDDSALTAGNLDISSNAPEGKVGILDLGAKKSIVNVLENLNYQVVAIKPDSSAEDILSMNLKGLLISNGPGDPRSLIDVIKTINNLIGKIPIFGICLGHQILSLACGLKVNKLEFGHHGSNHPVKIKGIKKALITAQNHGFAVEEFGENLVHKDFGNIENYASNLNDGSNEGISLWDSMAYSVQFHPESGPGTSDGLQIFNPFVEMMEEQYAKNKEIKSILIIGSGPIVIGQACEFDYSGSQAAKALKNEGYRIILVNSNPATIMTDPKMADATYIEPLTFEFLKKIIEIEKPDAVLPTLGGQTALNLAMELDESNIFAQNNIKLLGASAKSIEVAENRWKFKNAMEHVGIKTLKAEYVRSIQEGINVSKKIGYPLMLRPSYILGGGGTGLVQSEKDLNRKLKEAFNASPTQEVLIEESVYGWKEFELEVMRDQDGNGVIVCGIENFDPMGVHTGDSITIAPIQTLSDKEYQEMRDEALLCLDTIGIATGGSNVQFAINPLNGERRIIEMNPRVSRSSALASKATGFPIAKFAALLAVGYNLTELKNDITGSTPASFEPVQDYVVVKIPRFDFPKFPSTDDVLGTSMQSVGEVMSIASTFTESLTKAIRSLEIGKTGIRNIDNRFINLSKAHLEEEIKTPRPRRIFAILEGIRRNWDIKKIADLSNIDIWFLNEIEKSFNVTPETTPTSILKMLGWTDEDLDSKDKKNSLKDNRVYKLVDTCSAEFESKTPYLYSTNGSEDDDNASNNKKVVVIGSGPNRIGQGIEFDYCCVHGVESLKENKYESIMINSNPETVSTDYDTADKLYFEPLSWDEVNSVLMREQPDSVIIQLGGQTPLKLAKKIHESGYNIAGSSLAVIDATEDRNLFQKLCESQDINQPISQIASNENDLIDSVNKIGFPVLLRPSYVLGGRAMRVVQNDAELKNYLSILASADEDGNPFNSGPLLVDQFLTDTVEVDVDLISDGKEVFIAGVLEHLEPAGVHSGDSTAVLPPFSIDKKIINEIEQKSIQLAKALNVKGLLNIQFAIKKDKLYILEANPRASRTMPFVAKVTGNQIIKAGTLLMLGHSLDFVKKETDYLNSSTNKIAIKKAIFPWSRFPAEDTMLGPEMKATGEVLGIGSNFGTALNKAYAAAGVLINKKQKGVFISLSDKEKPNFVEIAKNYSQLGFKIFTTEGTGAYLREHKISSTTVGRANDKSPTSLTIIEQNLVSLVINTPTFANEYTDGWKIRRLSHETGVAVVSSVREAQAFMKAFSEQENTLDDMEAIQNVS